MHKRIAQTLGPTRTAAVAGIFIAAAILATLLSLDSGTAQAKTPKPIYWGAIIGSQYTGTPPPWDMSAATDFGDSVGRQPSLLQFSLPFSECEPEVKNCALYGFPTEAMQHIREFGAIPILNWGSQSVPNRPQEPAFRLHKITHGKYDHFLRHFAEDAAQWGHPFFLRFNWEMNGFWFPWSPGLNHNTDHDYIASWRHVFKVFQQEGATNANWVWCPNVDFTGKLNPLENLYPGNAYVDWTCLDGFNWGKTSNSAGWMSFNSIFKSTYERVLKVAPNKPMMIGETASEERGGSKADWIHNLLNVVPAKYPKIRAMVWFDYKDQEMDWPLNSSVAATEAFKKGIHRPYYLRNVYSGLAGPKIKPPTWYAPPPELPTPELPTPEALAP
jgi:Glycosyl hydrolase family 26